MCNPADTGKVVEEYRHQLGSFGIRRSTLSGGQKSRLAFLSWPL
jgi:hypothetical protein